MVRDNIICVENICIFIISIRIRSSVFLLWFFGDHKSQAKKKALDKSTLFKKRGELGDE